MIGPPGQLGRVLTRYAPPVGDGRFWVVQGLVVLIFIAHQVVSGAIGDEVASVPHMAIDALYLVPVLYAALNFNLPGALATAGWVTVLIVIDLALSADVTEPVVLRHGVILGTVDVVAVFVGVRVNAEGAARTRLVEAEARYRSLFQANTNPVLVMDDSGAIRQANQAALALLGLPALDGGARLADLVGPALAAGITGGAAGPFSVTSPAGVETLVSVARALVAEPTGETLVQVVLQDVTAEARRRERAEAYAAAVLQAQEDERRRLAQELHDDTIQELIHLCRQLDRIDSEGGPTARREAVGDARALAEGIVNGVRDVARGLRPPALDDLGLTAALERLATEAGARSGVPVRLDMRTHGALNPSLQLVVFRIAQEALNNVERHAQARSARLSLSEIEGGITLEVVDDGCGFSVPATEEGGGGNGLGLLGMAERARLVGADLVIDSAPGRGTAVRLTIPRFP